MRQDRAVTDSKADTEAGGPPFVSRGGTASEDTAGGSGFDSDGAQ